MDFLAVLDYEHLDNGMFLASFARALSKRKKRGIIIHGDSEYTERIIQIGVMRDEAQIRAIKELNHRLVALFADEGISTIALNGFQKSLIKSGSDTIEVNKKQLLDMPAPPMVLISNLAEHNETGHPVPVSMAKLAIAFQNTFHIPAIDLFSIKKTTDIIHEDLPKTVDLSECSPEFKHEHIPESFHDESITVRLNTPLTF